MFNDPLKTTANMRFSGFCLNNVATFNDDRLKMERAPLLINSQIETQYEHKLLGQLQSSSTALS